MFLWIVISIGVLLYCLGILSFLHKRRKVQKIYEELEKNILSAIVESIKIKKGYEPTYDEVKKYYVEYLEEEKRNNEYQWTTIEPQTLEEYLDEWVEDYSDDISLFHYMTMKPNRGEFIYTTQYGD